MKKLTQKEIVLETVEYYRTHKRGLDTGGECSYLTAEGDMCAFGRCVTDPSMLKEGYGVLGQGNIEELLKPKYQGHSTGFWGRLQEFHDTWRFWTANEIGGQDVSAEGKQFIHETFKIDLDKSNK